MILRGQRRGEMVGARWSDVDWGAGTITIAVTILQLGGTITAGKPKTRTSRRAIFLDAASLDLLKAHHTTQLRARMRAGAAWQDNDLVFCRDDGTPWPPDYVSRRFKAAAKAAGVPVIKLHEGGRHTASSLGDDAGVDSGIRQRTLGHASPEMTAHYTHPRRSGSARRPRTSPPTSKGPDHERMFPWCSPAPLPAGRRARLACGSGRVLAGQRRVWDSNPR
jgi:integrase